MQLSATSYLLSCCVHGASRDEETPAEKAEDPKPDEVPRRETWGHWRSKKPLNRHCFIEMKRDSGWSEICQSNLDQRWLKAFCTPIPILLYIFQLFLCFFILQSSDCDLHLNNPCQGDSIWDAWRVRAAQRMMGCHCHPTLSFQVSIWASGSYYQLVSVCSKWLCSWSPEFGIGIILHIRY